MFAVLGVALPVALVAGIAARKPVPVSASLSNGISADAQHFAVTRWLREDLFTKARIRVALVREQTDAGRFAVALSAPKDFAKPDLLVYWIAGNTAVAETIPDDAVLLGGFRGATPLPFRDGVSPANGMLILYSLADHEVVAVSKPISF